MIISKYHLSVLSQLARFSSVEMARTLGARLRTGTKSGSIKQEKQRSFTYTLLLTEKYFIGLNAKNSAFGSCFEGGGGGGGGGQLLPAPTPLIL